MALSVSVKQVACERLLHFHPKKAIARELSVSRGVVRDWSIFVAQGDFDWISERAVLTRKHKHHQAMAYWIEHYPIGYSDVARQFGVRPSDLYTRIKRYLAESASVNLPAKIRLWDCLGRYEGRESAMDAKQIDKMLKERLSKVQTKEQMQKEMRDILISYESLFEEVMAGDIDELKKKELQRYLDQLREALQSLEPAKS